MKKNLLAGGLATVLLLGACEEGSTTEEDTTEEATTEETSEDVTEEETVEEETTEDTSADAEETEDTADVVEEETEVSEENLSVGESIELDGVTFTLNGASYTEERNEFAEVEADNVIVLDVSYENNTGEDYVPGMDIQVYADGSLAETYPVADVLIEPISDGRNVSGALAFAIVGEPSEIEVEFSPFMSFSGEKAIYTVTPE